MFDKRKKAREAARIKQIKDAWTTQESEFDEEIKNAGAIKDPAQKVLALQEISKKISGKIYGEKSAILDQSDRAGLKTLAKVGIPSMLIGFGSAPLVLLTPLAVLSVPVLIVGTLGSVIASEKRSEKTYKKLTELANNHLTHLNKQQDQIAGLMKETVTANVKEISASPLLEKIRQIHSIKDIFSDAAAKQITNDQKELAALKEAAEAAAEKDPARRPAKPSYDDLKGL